MAGKEQTVWQRIVHQASRKGSGYVIDEKKVRALTGIPDALRRPVEAGTHNLLIDRTGWPTLLECWWLNLEGKPL